MTTYTIINPSDPYTLIADDLVLAAISVCLLGSGKYALEAADGSEGVPFFLFGGHDEWFAAHGAGSLDAALTAATGQRAEALAKVLESVTIVGTRSSLNDIGEAAARLAAGVRKLVPHTPERTPYDAMGPVDAPNPPAARATLADAQPGGRVRLGDQAERARFEAWLDNHPLVACSAGMAWQVWQAALSAQPSPGGQGGLNYERMFVDACAALAEVSRELGCDPEQGGSEPILAAIAELREALAARQPVGEVSVKKEDANNYCLILRALGMEEEGDPVAEVQALIEARDRQPVGQEPIGRVFYVDRILSIEWRDGMKPLEGAMLYATPPAQQPAQVYLDGLDRALGEAIDQRDRYHEVADDLAGHIAAITGVDIGEHSSANCPWQNAIEAAEEYKPAQAVDLGQLPRVIELLSNVSRTLVDWAADEQREAIGIVKALIDVKAVGNG